MNYGVLTSEGSFAAQIVLRRVISRAYSLEIRLERLKRGVFEAGPGFWATVKRRAAVVECGRKVALRHVMDYRIGGKWQFWILAFAVEAIFNLEFGMGFCRIYNSNMEGLAALGAGRAPATIIVEPAAETHLGIGVRCPTIRAQRYVFL